MQLPLINAYSWNVLKEMTQTYMIQKTLRSNFKLHACIYLIWKPNYLGMCCSKFHKSCSIRSTIKFTWQRMIFTSFVDLLLLTPELLSLDCLHYCQQITKQILSTAKTLPNFYNIRTP